jgi:predicted DNA-binding transcriptional regulator YafY
MADVTERTLALLSALQTGRSYSGEELTGLLGVSPRTLRRDVDRLRGYGYPVETQPGPGGYYRLAAGRAMPPLVLDDEEAIATLLALAALAALGPAGEGGIDAAATRAYGKLDQFLPARLRPRVASIRASLETSRQQAPTVPARTVGELADAIARREVVRFGYTDANGRRTERRVEPYRQVQYLLRWYLLAWDIDRADWRVFRLDRIADLQPTAQGYAERPLPAESALDYLRQGINRGKTRVTVSVAALATHVVDVLRYQDAEIEPVGDDRTRVRLAIDPGQWQWLVLNLAMLDADFRIEEGAGFAEACRRFGQRLLDATS